MKHYFAICFSFLVSICLTGGFVKAQDQNENQEVEQVVQGLQDMDINLDDISIEDITYFEENIQSKDLALKDKLLLIWAYLKIRTSECKDATEQHVLRNQRKYIWGSATALILLSMFGIYYFGKNIA